MFHLMQKTWTDQSNIFFLWLGPTPRDLAVYPAGDGVLIFEVVKNGKTDDCGALRGADDSRRRRVRYPVLQASVLGTADSEHRNRPGLCSFLFEIPEASMSKACVQWVPPRTIAAVQSPVATMKGVTNRDTLAVSNRF